ncbi:hypothetical protein B296_00036740 [Ensete ventricosum]|uniref:Uncharacterized protein n=1 Tax=Ensete ventricosum TaxID=4639 RepID=A0A426XJ16_ENSVE|nr:hypothetical protein B296_00036740 [Ensete ventricosum]
MLATPNGHKRLRALTTTIVAAEGDMSHDHKRSSSGHVGEKLSLDSEEEEQKLSLDNESEYGGTRLGDQDQEVSTDLVIGRGSGHRGHNRRGRAMQSRVGRALRKRRRAAVGPTSIEEEKPSVRSRCSVFVALQKKMLAMSKGHERLRAVTATAVATEGDMGFDNRRSTFRRQKLSLDSESEYGNTGLRDQDQEVSTDLVIRRGRGRRGHSCRGRATRSCTARAPSRRRRVTTGPASMEEEEPSVEITCSRVDGR